MQQEASLPNVNAKDYFFTLLKSTLENQIHDILEKEADAACERLRIKLKQQISAIAISLLDHYSIKQMGQELVITVRNPCL